MILVFIIDIFFEKQSCRGTENIDIIDIIGIDIIDGTNVNAVNDNVTNIVDIY